VLDAIGAAGLTTVTLSAPADVAHSGR
jgi:hypothetical protein